MNRFTRYLAITILPLSLFLIFTACEKTLEEEVIKPIERMYGQKSIATSQAAVSNVQTVRAALMRYPAISSANEYPGEMEIFDYGSLRDVLADENLPPDMVELMWDPANGITYISDGYSFTFQVRSVSGETITATTNGVTEEQ